MEIDTNIYLFIYFGNKLSIDNDILPRQKVMEKYGKFNKGSPIRSTPPSIIGLPNIKSGVPSIEFTHLKFRKATWTPSEVC
jgi:hypothetical protein